jgi:hypothetical protein
VIGGAAVIVVAKRLYDGKHIVSAVCLIVATFLLSASVAWWELTDLSMRGSERLQWLCLSIFAVAYGFFIRYIFRVKSVETVDSI